jgi:hypothetical protein
MLSCAGMRFTEIESTIENIFSEGARCLFLCASHHNAQLYFPNAVSSRVRSFIRLEYYGSYFDSIANNSRSNRCPLMLIHPIPPNGVAHVSSKSDLTVINLSCGGRKIVYRKKNANYCQTLNFNFVCDALCCVVLCFVVLYMCYVVLCWVVLSIHSVHATW